MPRSETPQLLQRLNLGLTVAIAAAIPAVVYLVNGRFEPWSALLGVCAGLGWWVFGPFLALFLLD